MFSAGLYNFSAELFRAGCLRGRGRLYTYRSNNMMASI